MQSRVVKHDRFSVSIKWIVDAYSDTSFYGKYSDKPSESAIDRLARGDQKRNELRYFHPADPSYAEEAYQRMEALERGDWSYLYCEVNILLDGHDIGNASLYGIESDCSLDYEREVEMMLITEAIKDAQEHVDRVKTIPTEALFLISLPAIA